MTHYSNTEFNILQNNNGNLIAQLKSNPSDFYFIWEQDRVEFKELDPIFNQQDEQGVIRILSINSTGCKIQFRATQSLRAKQKPRHMIATAHFSKEDMQFIIDQINLHL